MAYKRSRLTNAADWLRFKAVVMVVIYWIFAEVVSSAFNALADLLIHIRVDMSLGKLYFDEVAATQRHSTSAIILGFLGFVWGITKARALFEQATQFEWMAKIEEHLEAIKNHGPVNAGEHKFMDKLPF